MLLLHNKRHSMLTSKMSPELELTTESFMTYIAFMIQGFVKLLRFNFFIRNSMIYKRSFVRRSYTRFMEDLCIYREKGEI